MDYPRGSGLTCSLPLMAYSVRSARINGLVAVQLFTHLFDVGFRRNTRMFRNWTRSLWATAATTLLSQSATQPGMDRRPLSCPRSTGSFQREAMERLLNVRLVEPARMSTWVSANVFTIRYRAGGRFARPNAVPVGHTQQMASATQLVTRGVASTRRRELPCSHAPEPQWQRHHRHVLCSCHAATVRRGATV